MGGYITLDNLDYYNRRIQAQINILENNLEQLRKEFEEYKNNDNNNRFTIVLGGYDD